MTDHHKTIVFRTLAVINYAQWGVGGGGGGGGGAYKNLHQLFFFFWMNDKSARV